MSEEKPRARFAQVIKAVLWAFLGIRKGSEYEKDIAQIRVWQVILIGLLMAFLLVMGLVFLVKHITH